MVFDHEFKLAVVRHGRTAWNADGRFQGQTDVPLDATGRAQAASLAEYMRDDEFDLALTSDLARASETAKIVLDSRPLTLEEDVTWREMRFGVWEGLAWPEIVARFPHLADDAETKPKFYTPEGGEAFDDVCARVERGLRSLDSRVRDGARVLIVTHAGVLHAMLRVVLGEDEAAALAVRFAPATVTRFTLGAAGGRLVTLNASLASDVPA